MILRHHLPIPITIHQLLIDVRTESFNPVYYLHYLFLAHFRIHRQGKDFLLSFLAFREVARFIAQGLVDLLKM